MGSLRLAWRIPAFLFVTAFWWAASGGGHLLLSALGRSSLVCRARMMNRWARCMAPVLGLRTETIGRPPTPPFLLVCNHLGYIDVVTLGRSLPAVFVARGDAADWPLFGKVCRAGGTLFIDRARKRDIPRVAAEIEAALRQGAGVVVFPEGTSSAGDRVERFKSSLLEVAARASLPVCYATLTYRTPEGSGPARTRVCWWGDTGLVEHVLGLFRLPRIWATVEFGEETITADDRKKLAVMLWNAVSARFRPVSQQER